VASSRSLRPLGGWDFVSRGRFETHHDGPVWTVDLDYVDFGENLHLYRDGVEVEVQKSPATFHLGTGGTIEASTSLMGMRQVDLVVEDEATMLTPVEGTVEGWRLQLERERPRVRRLIGAISWTVLAVALVYEVPLLHVAAGPCGQLAGVLLARADDLRDPVVGLVEHLVQQERGPLLRRQALEQARKASDSESAISALRAGSSSALATSGSGSHSPT
jgi:hypothetical protein